MTHWGHVGGVGALIGAYSLAGVLVVADGPLPYGDVIAAGILLIPDVVIYGIGYDLASSIGHGGSYAFPWYDKRPKVAYNYSVMF